jgi:hypothetical protein
MYMMYFVHNFLTNMYGHYCDHLQDDGYDYYKNGKVKILSVVALLFHNN